MKLYFLYKTVCRVNKRVYHGVYASNDVFFGTDYYTDPYIGQNLELIDDLARYGRAAFTVEALRAFPTAEQANLALERYKPFSTYQHGNIGLVRTEEHKKKIGEANKGQRRTPQVKQRMANSRSKLRWIQNGEAERQIGINDVVPEGWKAGRLTVRDRRP
jgi:hypothetical protein